MPTISCIVMRGGAGRTLAAVKSAPTHQAQCQARAVRDPRSVRPRDDQAARGASGMPRPPARRCSGRRRVERRPRTHAPPRTIATGRSRRGRLDRRCSRRGLRCRSRNRRVTRTTTGGPGPPVASRGCACEALLDLDARAGLLELGLELVGLVLVDALLDGLGGLVDERLGLLEAEAGRRADDLDDLDLLVAGAGEDDVERGLLLGGGAVAVAAGRRRPARRPRRRSPRRRTPPRAP